MKIESNDKCTWCKDELETLDHIYLDCTVSCKFKDRLKNFIVVHIDSQYSDDNDIFFISCYHNNSLINYCNLVGKYYLGRSVQMGEIPLWSRFAKTVKRMLCGEKGRIKTVMDRILP